MPYNPSFIAQKEYKDTVNADIEERMSTAGHFVYDNRISAEDNLKNLYDVQTQQFEDYSAPLIEHTESELASNRIRERGEKEAARLDARTRAQLDRTQSRFAGRPTVAQARAIERNAKTAVAGGKSTVLNTTRAADRSYKDALRGDLINISSSLTTQSMGQLTGIASNQAQRRASASASSKGAMSSTLGLVGGIIGGIYGGPAGAAAGSAAGSAVGQKVG